MKIGKDCGDLPARIAALAEHYKEVWDVPVNIVMMLCVVCQWV